MTDNQDLMKQLKISRDELLKNVAENTLRQIEDVIDKKEPSFWARVALGTGYITRDEMIEIRLEVWKKHVEQINRMYDEHAKKVITTSNV